MNSRPPKERLELPLVKAPDSIWTSIEAALDAQIQSTAARPRQFWAWGLGAAALIVIGVFVWRAANTPKPEWNVVRVDGQPSIGSRPIGDAAKIAAGERLRTDASSRARIAVSDIGTVEVSPNTQIQMVAARPSEQRLKLISGEIAASVSAPPRLFFVDTPASTAVDLGCAYTMKADGEGNGILRVTLGWVSLEWEGRESLVPAGASCRTRKKVGPGTPFFEDASQLLKDAVAGFDFNGASDADLETVLAEARVRDTLTLWHLLSRVAPADRPRVYRRIAEIAPPPATVSRDKILQLDRAALKLWREELAWKW
ncbi:MAG: FecR domain-containing protein [Bryobacterales bacterium]|nr:FecR domain-containing protein [Bryobacterales bacterium]MBV9396379.1 FecR domain-containing protein [Bryobacterales bacterium]